MWPWESKKPALTAMLLAALLAGCTRSPDPTAGIIAVREPWTNGPVNGIKISTAHYRIFTSSTNHALLSLLPALMEQAYSQYVSLTGLSAVPADAQSMTMYLLADRRQWVELTRQVAGPAADTYLAVQSGGYCHRGVCVLWDLRYFGTYSVGVHEGMHQFLYHRLSETAPAWVEEALASVAEGFGINGNAVAFTPEQNAFRLTALRTELSHERWIPLERLLASDAGGMQPEELADYYGQLWAMMLYLRSNPQHGQGFKRLLADAAAGRMRAELAIPPEMGHGRAFNRAAAVPLFQHYIQQDLEQFEAGYRQYARKLARLE